MNRSIIPLLASLTLAPCRALAQMGPNLDLTWNTIDAGGGVSSGGGFDLISTIGQHAAGEASGGTFQIAGGFLAGSGLPQMFADWVSVGSTEVQGTLDGASVTLTSSIPDVFANTVLDGSSTVFDNSQYFTPPLTLSDSVHFRGRPDPVEYSFLLGRPVHDPVLHFASLASTLTFEDINPVRISGQSNFSVAGNAVVGTTVGPPPPVWNDANGTVLLPGWHSTITFKAHWPLGSDEIHLQLGALPACYADCNENGSLTIADFGCFQSKFVAGNPYADCNASGSLTIADFGCFQTAFVAGCP